MESFKDAIRPCPVCGNGKVSVISKQYFELPSSHPLPPSWDVVSCPTCHFAYADTSALQETYDYYYSKFSKYEHNATSTGGGTTSTDRQRLEETANQIVKVLGDDESILDLGCANGGLLAALKKIGLTLLTGVDPSISCTQNTAKLGVETITGSIFDHPLNGRKFSVVILCHVLEHIRDLQTAAILLQELVARDGYLYIEVPDASRYSGYSESPFQDFNIEHINHFSYFSLSNLFASKGFVSVDQGVRDISTPAGWVYPSIWCLFKLCQEDTDFNDQWHQNPSLKVSLDEYTAKSLVQIEKINRILAPLVKSKKPVLIWGTGQLTLKLLVQSILGGCNIIGFIDSNPGHHGRLLRGIEIFSPEILKNQHHSVIIGSLLHHKAIENLILANSPNSRDIIKFT
tara:strand:- start:2539 stop:3741 length:1203 start_codon:yes stop_codon:yes gene_type:complete